MRWARVELAGAFTPRPIVVRVGRARITVERGFDTETLAAVIAVLERRPS
jgi:hypothetical protein